MDEKDYGIFLEEYVLTDDPIANAAKNVKKEGKATKKKKKIYPNDPCPCNSGKKYKYAVVNKAVRLSNSILYRNSHWKILIYQRLA